MPPTGSGGRNFQWNFNVNQKDLDRLKQTMTELAKQSQTMTDAQTKFNDVLQKGFQPPKGANAGNAAGGGGADWARMAAGVLSGRASSLLMGGPTGMVVAAAVEGLTRVYDTLKGLGHEAVRLAGVFSPAHLKQFEMATGMVQATIGRRLVPVLELFTEVTRGLAEVLANVLPSADDVREAVAPLKVAFAELKESMILLAPVIRDSITHNIRILGAALQALDVQLTPILMGMRLLGMTNDRKPPNSPDLPGMASKFTGVEDVGRELAKQFSDMSFAMGKDKKSDPQQQAADRLASIDAFLANHLLPVINTIGGENVAGVQAVIRGFLGLS